MGLNASVVIPTYNKREFLELTLASLVNQTCPHKNFEVIVVNDGSTDSTHKLFSENLDTFPVSTGICSSKKNKGTFRRQKCWYPQSPRVKQLFLLTMIKLSHHSSSRTT